MVVRRVLLRKMRVLLRLAQEFLLFSQAFAPAADGRSGSGSSKAASALFVLIVLLLTMLMMSMIVVISMQRLELERRSSRVSMMVVPPVTAMPVPVLFVGVTKDGWVREVTLMMMMMMIPVMVLSLMTPLVLVASIVGIMSMRIVMARTKRRIRPSMVHGLKDGAPCGAKARHNAKGTGDFGVLKTR